MVVFGQKVLYSGKSYFIRGKWLYLSKSGCIEVKVVVFLQGFSNPARVVVFGQSGCFLKKRLCLCNVVILGHNGFIQARVFVFGQNCCILAKWLYSGKSGFIRTKVVAFGQRGCVRAKVVVCGQRWMYSGKTCCIRAKMVLFGQSGCIRAKWS